MAHGHVIEILYTARCKYLALAVERVRHALSLRGDDLDVEVRLILVESFTDAMQRRFRGSPSVRVGERDVETRPGAIAPIGLLARGYVVDGKIERAPTVDAITRALDELVVVDRARTTRGRAPAHSFVEALT